MRATLEARGGYIFKTMGDEFCAVFFTAPDAIVAALDAQRAMLSEDFSRVDGLRVRMALHTGAADERSGDYFGPAVNRVARLLAIGHGGQVLVSGISADLLQGEMPPQSSLRDLGAHRLKDLARPEQVYQLVAPDLPETFPTLRSLDELPNNLPPQLTSFVGREHEMTEIKALIAQHRLVTLVGTGGAGKTRCAVQIGADMLDGSGDGVWLAELAPISDPSLVVNVIAQALNVQQSGKHPLLETVLAYLKRKRLLLIIDNCEHVIGEARNVVAAILRGCPDVHILATSREGLNVAGEQVYRMPSLAAPSIGQARTADDVRGYGAVQLFVDRALLADTRFACTDESAPYVAEICRRLDGIPLAIELAAARVKVLSPQQLAQKLDERFRVLTGGDRSALPRQQTMRALIDWSYDLLSEDERRLFRTLAIFAGGFTLDTATGVCSSDAMDELAVLDGLTSLVDKSLVHAEAAGSGTRYRLLESTRQYAREKLTQSGEDQAAGRAHAATFLALAEQLDRDYETTPDRAWLAQIEPEMENFRAALVWAFGSRGEARLGQQLVGVLRGPWNALAPAEGRRWVQVAQERADIATPADITAALDLAEASLAANLTQYKASLAAAERAITRYRELADPRRAAQAEQNAGSALIMLGRTAEGEALLQQALTKFRALGARKASSFVLATLAAARQFVGDVIAARERFSEALSAARGAGAERNEAQIAGNLAEAEFRAGDPVTALRLSCEARSLWRAFHATKFIANSLSNDAAYLVAQERYDEALVSARDALAAARDTQAAVVLACTLQHLAAVGALRPSADAQLLENRRRAARIVGYVDARFAALEASREYTEQQECDAMLPVLRDALGEDELPKLMAEGGTWSEDQAVAEAMAI
jgi:predicted ATPase